MVMDLIDPTGTVAVGRAVTLPTATKAFPFYHEKWLTN